MAIKITDDMRKRLLEMGVTIQTINNWKAGRTIPTRHYQYILDSLRGKKKVA